MLTGNTQCKFLSEAEAETKIDCLTFYQVIKTNGTDGDGEVYSILILQFEENEYIEHDFIYDVSRDFSEAARICAMLSEAGVTTASARDVVCDYTARNGTVD